MQRNRFEEQGSSLSLLLKNLFSAFSLRKPAQPPYTVFFIILLNTLHYGIDLLTAAASLAAGEWVGGEVTWLGKVPVLGVRGIIGSEKLVD